MSTVTRTLAVGTAVAVLAVACSKVPYTDRKQFNAIPAGVMNSMGKSTYAEMLGAAKLEKGTDDAKKLRAVGDRISRQADAPDYAWEMNLLADEQVNAWCLPGGYIGFYTGILPVLQNESGMAFVMGHEVGHALAHHSAERMTQQFGLAGALSVIDMLLKGGTKLEPKQRKDVMAVLGLGVEVGVALPFSRAHEKEADVIGLMLMAEGGYPPKESVVLWDRMEQVSGKGPPAFLSTHPSNEARQENLQEWMGQAKKKYARAKRDGEDPLRPIW